MLKYPDCSLSRKGVNYQMILSRFNLCIKVDNDGSHSLRQKTLLYSQRNSDYTTN